MYLAIEIWTVARCNVEGESEAFLRRCKAVSYLVETNPKLEFVNTQASCGSKSLTLGMTGLYELRITSFRKRKATTLFFESIELGIDRVFNLAKLTSRFYSTDEADAPPYSIGGRYKIVHTRGWQGKEPRKQGLT